MHGIRAGLAVVLLILTSCRHDGPVTNTAQRVGDNLAHTVGAPLVTALSPSGTWSDHAVVKASTSRFDMLLVLEQSTGCQNVAAETVERVNYRNIGNFGRLSTPTDTCNVIGILSLEAWFAQRQAPRGRAMVPRATSTYRVDGSDDAWTFLRGRFPLVSSVGIPGGLDMVIAVPHTEICETIVTRTIAQMEFRRQGAPLVLMSGREECPCEGVIQPQIAP